MHPALLFNRKRDLSPKSRGVTCGDPKVEVRARMASLAYAVSTGRASADSDRLQKSKQQNPKAGERSPPSGSRAASARPR